MAEGNLTWKDFWKLTPEERLARCSELSEHDAYMVRLTEPMSVVTPPCNDCAYKHEGKPACDAFPDGISGEHIRAVMKDVSTPCGNGFQFKAKTD